MRQTSVELIYCAGSEPELPPPYIPVMAFLRERIGNDIVVKSVPCLHTGTYDPVRKVAGLPAGVWVTLISGAVVEPVAWLDLTKLSDTVDQAFLRELEKQVKIKLKSGD